MGEIVNVKLIFSQIPELLIYLPMTLLITVISMVIGIALGLVFALIRINRIPFLSQLIVFIISFVRGTPLLIQLYISFYGIPILLKYINYHYGTEFNINNISPLFFVLIAFSLNEAAYASESIRSALQAVDKGQIKAAQALGMNRYQVLKRVTLPIAFYIALPNLGNTLINLLKGTSLAFVCSVIEMTAYGKILAGSNYRYLEVYLSLAIIYWGLTMIIEKGINLVEKRLTLPDQPKELFKNAKN